MTKTQLAERNIWNLGYKIEVGHLKGKNYCKAIKEGQKTIFASNVISLNKNLVTHLAAQEDAAETAFFKSHPELNP